MKLTFFLLAAGFVLTAFLTNAHDAPGHKMLTPTDIVWAAGPPSLPPGASAVVLYGDPSKEGLFAMRLKLPKGFRIPPHTHPKPEVITVISGSFRLGLVGDAGHVKAFGPGSFLSMEPGLAHFAGADEETVVQLNSIGPWGVTYLDPPDDPRAKPR
jgi:quercetin dioxygenase-like cupin family protein